MKASPQSAGKPVPVLTLLPLPAVVPLTSPLAVAYRQTEGVALMDMRNAADENKQKDDSRLSPDLAHYVRDMRGLSGRQDYALPVTFGFSLTGSDCLKAVLSYQILSDKPQAAVVKPFPKGRNKISVWYLLPDTDYRYTVTVTLPKGKTLSASSTFRTADTPLIYSVEGGNNVRDIGGWPTASGRCLSYGKIIRGAAFDGFLADGATKEYITATPRGLAFLKHRLGIRFVCDLRDVKPDTEPSPLGPSVKRVGYAAWGYDRVFTTEYGRARMKAVFDDLTNPDRYPVYLHCSHGCDRTGTVCFLIEALLGVSLENCLKDYDYSALFHWARRDNEMLIGMIEVLQKTEGETLADKTENYLLSLGITAEQIETLRHIFLPDDTE